MKRSLVRAAAYPALGATKLALLVVRNWFTVLIVTAFLLVANRVAADGALDLVMKDGVWDKPRTVTQTYVEPANAALLHEGLATFDAQKVTDAVSPDTPTNMDDLAYNEQALAGMKEQGFVFTGADFYAVAPGPDHTTYAFYVIHVTLPDGTAYTVWEILVLDDNGLVLEVN